MKRANGLPIGSVIQEVVASEAVAGLENPRRTQM